LLQPLPLNAHEQALQARVSVYEDATVAANTVNPLGQATAPACATHVCPLVGFGTQARWVAQISPASVLRSQVVANPPSMVGIDGATEPEQVAVDVVRAMDARKPVVYAPAIWALVMLVIRLLPRFVMRRIGF